LIKREDDGSETAISSSNIEFTSGDGAAGTEYDFVDSSVRYLATDTSYDG